MDIHVNDLRNEFKAQADKTLGGLRHDLEQVNTVIQNVHDELETTNLEWKQAQQKSDKELQDKIKALVKSNKEITL